MLLIFLKSSSYSSSRFGLSGVGLPDLDVEYLVIAGGGSGGNGGNKCAGGGGAGGYRSSCTDDTYSGELQSVETPLTLEIVLRFGQFF